MRKNKSRMCMFLIVCLFSTLFPAYGSVHAAGSESSTEDNNIYVVTQDGTKKLEVNYVNFNVNQPDQWSNYVALYTSGAPSTVGYTNHSDAEYAGKVFVKSKNVAIQVNEQDQIMRVIGPLQEPVTTATEWEDNQYIDIPEGGYVLISSDNSWNTEPKRRANLFAFKGGTIALERKGERLTAADFLPSTEPGLDVEEATDKTVTTPSYTIKGKVLNYKAENGLSVKVGDIAASIQSDGSFNQPITLLEGENPISVKLLQNDILLVEKQFTLTYQKTDLIEIEAPPEDVTINPVGPKKPIHYIDKDITAISNVIAIFTTEYGAKIQIPTYNVAIQVDASSKVTAIINPAKDSGPPQWTAGELNIPQGGYVVMAQDDSYDTIGLKKYLATSFKLDDVVKLHKNGSIVPITELMSGTGTKPRLQLDGMSMYTTAATKTTISGKIANHEDADVSIGGQTINLQADGTFSHETILVEGPNYIDVVLSKNENEVDRKSVIVYSRPSLTPEKQIILWVDQAANAKKFQSSDSVLKFLQHAKDAGVTDVAFDVKGVEGYVSYKKSSITKRPYVSEMIASDRKGSNPDLDLLELFLEHGHALGLKIHAAFNVFAEGSIAMKDFAIIDDHLEWEERVYRPEPEDNGEIKRLRESAYGKKGLSSASGGAVVLFVNPSNDEVRKFQLDTFEEVLQNYDVDGIILDRGRYDNETADFSDETKAKFTEFLQSRDKELTNWPSDIFHYDNGRRVDGPLIQDWWEFRSSTIQSFVEETRSLVDSYSEKKNKKIQTSAYVGAWYESYYLNGVHWGSKNFRYDSRLNFPVDSIYTDNYYETGYLDSVDFLMVGTYYDTIANIQRYITIDSIVTNGEKPLYAGMALADLQDPALQREIFQTALGSSDGLMLFDASLANWPVVKASIQDEDYVKDYQIGISNPRDPASFIEGSYYNVSRNLGDLNVFSEEFGTSTGTNKFGVEVVTDKNGIVTKVVNKNQAINWSWGAPEDNNSPIPTGGMVVSALDENGVRTKRQLVANTYNVGDDIRSAALSGFLNYDGKTVASKEFKGNVKLLGAGSNIEVKLNNIAANVNQNGDFSGNVDLQPGSNRVTFAVYVDGMKTNEKTIQVTYSPSTSPSTGGALVLSPVLKPTEGGIVVVVTATQTTDADGNPAMKAALDEDTISKAVAELQKLGNNASNIVVEVPDSQQTAIVTVPAQALASAAASIEGAALIVKSGSASYKLPASLLDTAALAKQLGVSEDHIQVTLTITKITGTNATAIAEAAAAAGGKLIGDAYDFQISVQAGGKTIDINNFKDQYVERTLLLNGLVPSHSSVIVFDPDTKSLTFVPARFTQADDSTTATFKRTGNSIYAVVAASKSFQDTKGHWAQADIDLLASKQLAKGVTDNYFVPDRSITRAEFAALLVRTLGLVEDDWNNTFSDVHSGDWYAAAVATAAQAGLIQGYEDGTFRPNQAISREQLAVLASRAKAFVTKMAGSLSTSPLRGFSDADAISSWAQSAMAEAVNSGLMNGLSDSILAPKNQSTRAQAIVILKRLAIQLELMDKN